MAMQSAGPMHYRYYTYRFGDFVSAGEERFAVLRETPSGYWVVPDICAAFPEREREVVKRWVSKTSRKRYCYPTREEAWESYQIRTSRWVMHLKTNLRTAEAATRLGGPGPCNKITLPDLSLEFPWECD